MKCAAILLTATLIAATAGTALAQSAAIFDPQQLPALHGQVGQYSLTPRGDIDGVILQDGTQVFLPPHLGTELAKALKPGDKITIHGLKARVIPVILALSITNDATAQTVADSGPPSAPPQPLAMGFQWLQVEGKVREPLYGPRGDVNGALLEDGTMIRLPPDQAVALGINLKAGAVLVAQGYGASGPYGKSLGAQQIGASATQLVQVAPPGPPRGPDMAPPPPPPFRP